MALFTLEIDGNPVPKGRPRFTRTGRVFTPSKTFAYEQSGKHLAREIWKDQDLITTPISCSVVVKMPIPKSWPRKKRAAAEENTLHHTSRPDLDNFIKIALDILNGTVISDDSIVVSLSGEKIYSVAPSLLVRIEQKS